jgi:hypothetical protein
MTRPLMTKLWIMSRSFLILAGAIFVALHGYSRPALADQMKWSRYLHSPNQSQDGLG